MADRCSLLVSGARTPIGSFSGQLADKKAPELGAIALQAAMQRVSPSLDPQEIDEVIMGCVLTAALGQAPARQAAKAAGFPDEVGALTINKVCGSSLKAVTLADQMIRCGDADIVAAGGMESMSNVPFYLTKARNGYRLGHGTLMDGLIHDGLWDPYNDFHMGNAGEICAKNLGIDRQAQDAYARRSYERAVLSLEKGLFLKEIVSIALPKGRSKENENFCEDEEIRRGWSRLEKMDQLKPAFQSEGSITAANSSKLSDGGAAVILMSEQRAKDLNVSAKFRILGHAQAALAPEEFPLAPIHAIQNLTDKLKISLSEVDRFEINEAFSIVSEACIRKLELDAEKVNVRGGAVALGHPIGASGARILVTLMYQLESENLSRGIASICLGGGEAVALMIERL